MDQRYRGLRRGPPLINAASLMKAVGAGPALSQKTALISLDPALARKLKAMSPKDLFIQGAQGFGAPSLALQLEFLAARGIQQFLTVGLAGTLSADLNVGQMVIAEKALIDEGTSPHYGNAAGEWAQASKPLLKKFSGLGRRVASWTTDAPLREHTEQVQHYAALGIQCVEMETSALYSLGGVLGLETLAFYVISDELHGGVWKPHFGSDVLEKNLENLAQKIIDRVLE